MASIIGEVSFQKHKLDNDNEDKFVFYELFFDLANFKTKYFVLNVHVKLVLRVLLQNIGEDATKYMLPLYLIL